MVLVVPGGAAKGLLDVGLYVHEFSNIIRTGFHISSELHILGPQWGFSMFPGFRFVLLSMGAAFSLLDLGLHVLGVSLDICLMQTWVSWKAAAVLTLTKCVS